MTHPVLAVVEGKKLITDYYGNLVEIDEWSRDIALNWRDRKALS